MTSRTITLVDGSGFIFRAYHALPPLTRADGTPVGAVAGFCNMLSKLLREPDTQHLAVVFDVSRQTFRTTLYPPYKAHRPPAPDDLIPQFALIREATRAYGVPVLEVPDYEADDVIASYAAAAVAQGWQTRIISADKDLMQLIRDGVMLIDPLKYKPITADDVLAKFGVPPDKVVEVQGLAGDSSDNVPGVPGIGVKTAAELINLYGDIETLLARAGEIKQPKRREALQNNAELARISRRLVLLDDAVPLPVPMDDLHVVTEPVVLRRFLQAQGFKSLLQRLDGAPPAEPLAENHVAAPNETISTHYTLIQSATALREWLAPLPELGLLAIDTETTSLTPSTTKLVGISLAIKAGVACYIPLTHCDPQTGGNGAFDFGAARPEQMSMAEMIAILAPILADPAILKIAHNLKFDLQVLVQHGLIINGFDDTMLLSYVQSAGLHGHGLDELVLLHCQHRMIPFSEVAGTGKQQITFDRVPLAQACAYAAEDADYTLRLWHKLKPALTTNHVARVYERLERPLIPVVAAMETAGVRIEPVILQGLSHDFGTRMMALEAEIHQLAGHSFNVASPKQLGDVLFAEMNLPGGVRGKNGAYSTSADVLEPLAEQGHEIVSKLLDWRSLAKLRSTYSESLPQQINAQTQRVHTSFSLVGAATGRLSSTEPNLQNIPIRTADGRAIRRAFVAAPQHVLLSVDYSQIELRLVAEMAGITALIQAFKEGADIHTLTASQVFGMKLADVSAADRRAAKAVNFGIIYGISGFGLAKQIGCTAGEANHFIKQYLDRFHELRDWMEATKIFAREHGYVETLFGRRIHLQGIRDKNGARRAFAERQAINAPIQGTAADIIKRAMIRLPDAFKTAHLSAKMLLQVHDELLFEVPEAELAATAALVTEIMQNAPLPVLQLKIPLLASAGHGLNWADAH